MNYKGNSVLDDVALWSKRFFHKHDRYKHHQREICPVNKHKGVQYLHFFKIFTSYTKDGCP